MKSASSRSAGRPGVKPKSTSMRSVNERSARASTAPDAAPDHPEADVGHIVRGIVRRGLVPVPPKTSISLRIDQDVLDWFKAQGSGYQTRINAVLKAFRDASL